MELQSRLQGNHRHGEKYDLRGPAEFDSELQTSRDLSNDASNDDVKQINYHEFDPNALFHRGAFLMTQSSHSGSPHCPSPSLASIELRC